MAQLAIPRRGWENEHLATFMLSRISFVAHPITVADDIGSDFFCTLFEPRVEERIERLFPRNSFAVQVKSNFEKISVTNKIDYLLGLELPFFVGVVDRSELKLSMFSGEYIPVMFSLYGPPKELTLTPVTALGPSGYCDCSTDRQCTLRMPLVCEISADETSEGLRDKARLLSQLCSLMHRNISARTSREYIFQLDQDGTQAVILAGRDSATTFRQNFILRLAEAFYNLEWILNSQPDHFNHREWEIYETLYKQLSIEFEELPPILCDIYAQVSRIFPPALSRLLRITL
jgi:hypothetical protein